MIRTVAAMAGEKKSKAVEDTARSSARLAALRQ
jgi:hypothetical protein